MYLYMNAAIFYNDLHYSMPPNSSKMLCQTHESRINRIKSSSWWKQMTFNGCSQVKQTNSWQARSCFAQTCSSSPPAGGISSTNMSTMSATANSDCPTPEDQKKGLSLVECSRTVNSPCLTYGLHEHNVVSGALAENNGLISCSGDSAKCSRGWRWSDKGVHVPGELSHTGLITQQRACSDTEEMRQP